MNPDLESTALDPTEALRRKLLVQVNSTPADRAALERRYGRVWSASELAIDFALMGFLAPFVVVRRKSDGQVGSLLFQHHPRYYFAFEEDRCATPQVECALCHLPCLAEAAHLHQGNWICHERCWDDRLKASE